MALNTTQLKTVRQWKSSIGLSEQKFYNLLIMFKLYYEKEHKVTLQDTMLRLGIKNPILKSYDDCLFFVLFQLKNGLTFDVLGLVFDTDGSNAQRNFERYLAVLEGALTNANFVPPRKFDNEADFLAYLEGEKDIIFDGTEFLTERPKDKEKQKKAYSGKKKAM